ncbi:hypothetical protein M413DRAFT_27368 [Hebeloma cylindrosporum]|uniref:DNA breaking-rejoining enzyme n=1 Tax=Hebeloma cylindrosporum TaxID=76867 RepID=A0A0C3BYY1_HEBCY|nr:hypothetical protein M413DRAFT_27368 [Hebeloma cylindrosporum h7]
MHPLSRIIQPRKPQSGRTIAPSQLRPHVAAADRLFSWDTPFGVRHREEISRTLPPPLVNSALAAIRGALAPNSKSTYAAGLLRFTQFCDKWDIPEDHRMPASYPLLCAFIGEHKGLQSGNTIKSWMSGLRSWHVVNHAPWYGDDEWVHLARISANKEGTKHKRPLRAPVSIEHLSALLRAIDLSNPFHAAVFAIALCTFFGCRRLGEITVTVASAFDEQYNVLRSATVHFRTLHDAPHSANFRIPWTKTTKELGASVILTARPGSPLCPVAALKNHLTVNASVPGSSALFAYTTASGQPKNMLKHEFLEFVMGIWSSAMLAHVLGHSFRIGGAVELLLAGVPPEIVAATGGWTSLAFLLYWRRMEEILPMSTSKAYNKSHFDSLASIFEQFRIAHKIPPALIAASDGLLSV